MNDQNSSIAAVSTKILGREMLIMLSMLMLISGQFIIGYAVYLLKSIGEQA